MAEKVDIVVSETGTDAAAQKIQKLGEAAATSATQVDQTTSALSTLKDSSTAASTPLQTLSTAAQNAGSATEIMTSQARAAQSILEQQQKAADRVGISLEEYQRRAQQTAQGMLQLGDATNQTSEDTKKHSEATEEATHKTSEFAEAGKLLREVLTALGLALTTDKLFEYADAYEKISDQLSSVSKNTSDLNRFEEQLFEISQRTGSSFNDNVSAFQKLSVQARVLGIDQKDLLQTIEGVDSAVRLSGGSAKDAATATDIFQRSLATGQVEGRQFRSLLIQFPQLGQLVAKGLNEPLSSLTRFSQTAPVAAKDFIEAFNRTSQVALEAGSTIRLSLGSALTVLQNAVTQYIGRLNEASGATNIMANVVLFLANNLTTIATIVRVAATVWASYYVTLVAFPAVIGLITSAFTALTAAIAANPLGALIVAITAATALMYQFGNSIRINSDGSISLLGALVGAFDLVYNGLHRVWTFLTTVFGPAFRVVGTAISFIFQTIIQIVRGTVNILSQFIPALQPLNEALSALSNPLVAFKDMVVESMTEATARLDETGEHTKTVAELLGGDDPVQNLSGAATKASGSMKALNEDMLQNGRVNASLIPVWDDAYQWHKKMTEQAKKASEEYAKDVKAQEDAVKEFALVSRNAFGDMIKASDEWALRTGANFNKVKDAASGTQSAIDSMASSASSRSSFGGGGSSSSSSDSGDTGGFQSTFNIDIGAQVEALKALGVTGVDFRIISLAQQNLLQAGTNNRTANMAVTAAWNMLKNLNNPAAAHLLQLDNSLAAGFLALGLPTFAQGGSFQVGGSGGTDSQLVQFWASPDERVTVDTPAQQRQRSEVHQGGKTIVVNMQVVTPDSDSFRRSATQNLLTLKGKLGQL